ncbi:hypothetical protein KO498_07180 [Lentibacter algarum]|uniref:hypothetical protein n=1 Tax=Lentibacter algarum TaxID=576131 RepID=UPI001C0682F9|nr:hypothetical protein [Lentibacter algarum]MBU2981596.1 hypothetical protein [Lentibacter algarum]
MWRFLFMVLALGAIAAFFTNPSEENAEAALGQMVVSGINSQDISVDKSAAGNALLIACKLRPKDCQKVLETQLSSQYNDYTLFSTFSAEGLGMKTWCIGAFTKLTCPGGINPE